MWARVIALLALATGAAAFQSASLGARVTRGSALASSLEQTAPAFAQAVRQAGINAGTYIAPTDQAMQRFSGQLTPDILKYHCLAEQKSSMGVFRRVAHTTLEGSDITTERAGPAGAMINGVSVVKDDIECGGYTVHLIDGVLIPGYTLPTYDWDTYDPATGQEKNIGRVADGASPGFGGSSYSAAPAYQQPAPSYQQPAQSYQQPAASYQQPATGGAPSGGFGVGGGRSNWGQQSSQPSYSAPPQQSYSPPPQQSYSPPPQQSYQAPQQSSSFGFTQSGGSGFTSATAYNPQAAGYGSKSPMQPSGGYGFGKAPFGSSGKRNAPLYAAGTPSQQSYQAPQQSYQAPQQSYQAPQQSYQAPQQQAPSYHQQQAPGYGMQQPSYGLGGGAAQAPPQQAQSTVPGSTFVRPGSYMPY